MADDPAEAGAPGTRDSIRIYEDERIRVTWDAPRCIHSAVCLNQLPAVFDVDARPWIDLSGADADAIAATIRACPSGALGYDGPTVEPEVPDEPTTIDVRPDGPLLMRGNITLQAPGGSPRHEFRVALCRCGESQNKPFCDNSHLATEFRDRSRP